MGHAYNPSNWEVQELEIGVQGQPLLQNKLD